MNSHLPSSETRKDLTGLANYSDCLLDTEPEDSGLIPGVTKFLLELVCMKVNALRVRRYLRRFVNGKIAV